MVESHLQLTSRQCQDCAGCPSTELPTEKKMTELKSTTTYHKQTYNILSIRLQPFTTYVPAARACLSNSTQTHSPMYCDRVQNSTKTTMYVRTCVCTYVCTCESTTPNNSSAVLRADSRRGSTHIWWLPLIWYHAYCTYVRM